jgi:ribulose-5-phosphate 4-epimerase/fuculose-1-phosphate aldolase
MNEAELRSSMVFYARSLFERGYSCGTSGNISARLPDGGLLLTPTNASLGELRAEELTRIDASGRHVDGLPGTKEGWLHQAMYRADHKAGAVVHLHSTYAVALSCLTGPDPADCLAPVTPYSVMKLGRVAKIDYARPGDASRADEIEALARTHRAILLSNHGPVVSGAELPSAVSAAEEFEEGAKLVFILKDWPHKILTEAQVKELNDVFGRNESC